MNISIYTIINELSIGINLEKSSHTSFDIQDVCICDESFIFEKPSPKTLYVVCQKQLPLLRKYKFTHIISTEKSAVPPLSLHTYAYSAAPIHQTLLLQQIQIIINKYNHWFQDVISEMYLYQSPQDIIDRCATLFPHPFAYFDTTRAMLYKTNTLENQTHNQLWNHALNTGFSPEESYDQLLTHSIQQNDKPFVYTSKNQYKDYYRLIAPIKINQYEVGCLGTNSQNTAFSMDHISIFYYIQQIFSLGLKYFGKLDTSENHLPWYYEKILLKEDININTLTKCVNMTQHQITDSFSVWVLRREEALPLENAMLCLHRFFPKNNIKIYQNLIIIIDYEKKCRDQKILASIQQLLNDLKYSCGISQEFENIMLLYHAYNQSLIALEYSKLKIVHAEKILNTYAAHVLSKAKDIAVLLNPHIIKLHDNKKNSDNYLLITLQTYLLTGFNVSLTAKKLYIHRHTATYRIELLQEIAGCDFSACTNEELLQILFSCEYYIKIDQSSNSKNTN